MRVVLAFIGAVVLLIAFIVVGFVGYKISNPPAPKPTCDSNCSFIAVVRDTQKYSDKSDASVLSYGNSLCYTLKSGGGDIVNALEDPMIVQAAKTYLCPDQT